MPESIFRIKLFDIKYFKSKILIYLVLLQQINSDNKIL